MTANRRHRINYQERFENYLNRYRKRARLKSITVAIAAVVFTAVALSLLAATLGDSLAYSSWLYYPARFALFVSIVVLGVLLFWFPYKRFSKFSSATELESTVPAFQGRIETYVDMQRRDVNSPFAGLLAKDAAKTAARAPVGKLIPTAEVIGPLVGAVAMLGLAGWLFTSMPLEWRAGIKHLWFGWIQSDILPDRTIIVKPGDTRIRVGDSLFVNATVDGFTSDLAELHVKNESSTEWETVDMNRQPDGSFDFTLYGITEPTTYYVTSAFTRSTEATVQVVVPARVENIELGLDFPSWTGRDPVHIASATDIAAVADTIVSLLISTDKPLTNGELIVNDQATPLTAIDDLHYQTSLVVKESGEYRIADRIGDDRIMLTPSHKITITEDRQPTISFTHPGGDWTATAIEEVTVSATAADDFSIEEVTLHYSVNGGEWQSLPLTKANDYSHLFMLEEFDNETGGPLIAGDLVTYYAEARDREKSVSTDILFIDVRPFERRFSQSQQSQQGGGGQQQQEQEISQRQKEILVATWNLIRDQKNTSNTLINPQDSATLLSDLQDTLADQADTLAQRAESRQLLDNDPDIAKFVKYIEEAAASMRPSAENLASFSFDNAVTHQQRALQYLKRAESIFNDITVNQSQGEGGGGGNAGRDMAEMYELEMDLAKNQYETPDTAKKSSTEDQSIDDAFNKLRDLARRQQALADAAAKKEELSMAERWQQEKLRRELEKLKRELEQLQRQQSASSEQSRNGESQQSDSQNPSENPSQEQPGGQGSGSQSSDATQQAMQQIDDALREMQNAEHNKSGDSASERQQALQNASEKLRQSLDRVSKARQQALQESLNDAADSVRDLSRQQQETSQQLRDAMKRAMQARSENRFDSGLTERQQEQLAEQKRAMQRQLEEVQQNMAEAVKRFSEQAPETSDRLQMALDEIERSKAAELMGISGDMIEEGMAPQAALREERVTEALHGLQNDLFETMDTANTESTMQPVNRSTAADATRTLQQLRQALEEALNQTGDSDRQSQRLEQLTRGNGQSPGSSDSENAGEGQNDSNQSDSQNDSQSGTEQTAQGPGQESGQQGSGQQGQSQSGQRDGSSWGATSSLRNADDQVINDGQAQLIEESTSQLEQMASAPIDGLSAETRENMRELAKRLQSENSGENARRIEANVRLLLRQLEQLELQIYSESQQATGVRTGKRVADPEGYDQRTADYFRRLSDELETGS